MVQAKAQASLHAPAPAKRTRTGQTSPIRLARPLIETTALAAPPGSGAVAIPAAVTACACLKLGRRAALPTKTALVLALVLAAMIGRPARPRPRRRRPVQAGRLKATPRAVVTGEALELPCTVLVRVPPKAPRRGLTIRVGPETATTRPLARLAPARRLPGKITPGLAARAGAASIAVPLAPWRLRVRALRPRAVRPVTHSAPARAPTPATQRHVARPVVPLIERRTRA